MIAELRRAHPDLIVLDAGELLDLDAPGNDRACLEVIAHAMVCLGAPARVAS